MFSVFCTALALVACNEPPPPQVIPIDTPPPEDPLPTVAPAVSWEDGRLRVEGQPTWLADAGYTSDGASLSVVGAWPSGTLVVAEGTTTPTSELRRFDVYRALGATEIFRADVEAGRFFAGDVTVQPNIPIVFRLSNGVELTTALPPGEVHYGIVDRAFEHAAEHGLAFDGEAPHAGPHSTHLVDEAGNSEIVGPARTLAEVDRVATRAATFAPDPSRVCDYIGGARLPLEIETDVVTLRDRRTAAVIETRSFTARGTDCPLVALDSRAIASPIAEIRAWLER